MKSLIYKILVAFTLTGLSVWLFFYVKAAEPGDLSSAHEEITDCDTCHIPWQGVRDDRCLQCHEFDDVSNLDPRIRFHEAGKYCLKCHVEHFGLRGDISRVDHTLFNGSLRCTQCHLDRHRGLFGRTCRECHGLATWKVEGFRHPREERRNCQRCHRPPLSHEAPRFWARIKKGHSETEKKMIDLSPDECWLCHTTHLWSHFLMKHDL